MAGEPSDLASLLNAAYAQRAMQYATPATMPAIQHSAYLQDALRQMRTHGGDNLRTGGALGTNLLAEAIDQFSANHAQKKLLAQTQSDQGAFDQRLMGMLGALDQSGSGPPPAPTGAPGSVQAAGAAPVSAPAATPPQPAPQAPQPPAGGMADALAMSPDERLLAGRMADGEARGEGALGQQAVIGVAMNRARATHHSLADVLTAPHQFSGLNARSMALDPNSPEMQRIMANIAPVLDGQMNPAGSADHFYNPALASPSWGAGPGQMIGHHKFMTLDAPPPGGNMLASDQPPAQAVSGPAAMPGVTPPMQLAQNTQQPPGAPPVMSDAGPGGMPAPQGPPMAPQGQPPQALDPGLSFDPSKVGPGPGPTPQQMQLIQSYMASPYPALREQGEKLAQEAIQARSVREQVERGTPDATGRVPMFGKSGRFYGWVDPGATMEAKQLMRPDGHGGFAGVESTQTQQVAGAPPGTRSQLNPITNTVTDSDVPNAWKGNAVYEGNGQYGVPGSLAPKITPAGGGGAFWSQKPGEAPTLTQGPITAEAVNQRGQQYAGRDEVKQARGALEALNSYGQALSTIHPSGIVGQQGIDAYIRAISAPTQGVRQGPVSVLIEHMNWPDAVKGHVLQAIGQGFLPPAVLKEMGQAIFLSARERVRSAQALADTDNQWATEYGFKTSGLGEDVPQMPDVPAYIRDTPPPPAQRKVGMTLWGQKGPVKWNGRSWDPVTQ